jgi:N-acetylglucosaminyldiphosphoundecaprenol N-acetyl-beta-D-mannosaminyltransferase
MSAKNLTRIRFLGLDLDAVTRAEMVSRVDSAIVDRDAIWLTFINVAVLVQATRDAEALRALEAADHRLTDGMGLLYGSRLLGQPLPEMVSGPYLLFGLLNQAAHRGHRVYFLGAQQVIIEQAAHNAVHNYPGLTLVGYRNGYFAASEEDSVVADVCAAKPDILFVGMGFPRERLFCQKWRPRLDIPVMMDVGGAFTVLAGVHRLAPSWVGAIGMEWVYRAAQEPRRLWKRYLLANSVFAWMLVRAIILNGRDSARASLPGSHGNIA